MSANGTTNGYGPQFNFQMPGLRMTGPLPSVNNTAEAMSYPYQINDQDVLLDKNDNEIAYFRSIDANGVVSVDRRRCVPEPEPTIEEIVDKRYVTKDDFATFIASFNEFRKEISDNVRKLAESGCNTTDEYVSTDGTTAQGSKRQVVHAAKRPKSAANAVIYDAAESTVKSGG